MQALRGWHADKAVQACSNANGAQRYERVPTIDHAAYEAACTRAWACMLSITLGPVTPGSELADVAEPDSMPRSNDATVTGTAGTRRRNAGCKPCQFCGCLGTLQASPSCLERACSALCSLHAAALRTARLCVRRPVAQLYLCLIRSVTTGCDCLHQTPALNPKLTLRRGAMTRLGPLAVLRSNTCKWASLVKFAMVAVLYLLRICSSADWAFAGQSWPSSKQHSPDIL